MEPLIDTAAIRYNWRQQRAAILQLLKLKKESKRLIACYSTNGGENDGVDSPPTYSTSTPPKLARVSYTGKRGTSNQSVPSPVGKDAERFKSLVAILKSGASLSQEEFTFVQNFPLDEMTSLLFQEGSRTELEGLSYDPGSVIKVVLSWKNINMHLRNIEKPNNETDSDLLNHASYQLVLYYIVLDNNKTVAPQTLLDFFSRELFDKLLAKIMPSNIVLETIQCKKVYPTSDKNSAYSKGYTIAGQLDSALHTSNRRYFVFTLISPYILGAKNDFTIRIPSVAKAFKRWDADLVPTAKGVIPALGSFFEQTVQISYQQERAVLVGTQADLSLQLAMETSRGNSPFRFLPVTNCSPSGFLSNVKNAKVKETIQYIINPDAIQIAPSNDLNNVAGSVETENDGFSASSENPSPSL